MKYNISTDKQELYSAEFEKYDGLAVAKKLQQIIKTYTPEDLEKIAISFGKYDDDTYEDVSNADFLKETAEWYKNDGLNKY